MDSDRKIREQKEALAKFAYYMLILFVFMFIYAILMTVAVKLADAETKYYFSKAAIKTTDNKIQGQDTGVNAGITWNYDVIEHLQFKGILSYEPDFHDGEELGFDGLLLDWYQSQDNIDYGLLLGRIIYAYGVYGDQRANPFYRYDIVNLSNNLWQHNQILYRHGDGFSVYANQKLGEGTFRYKFASLQVVNPEPNSDYVRDARENFGVFLNKVNWVAHHFEYNLKGLNLYYDHMDIKYNLFIKEDHWNNIYPIVPDFMQVRGGVTQYFILDSMSVQAYLGDFIASLQYTEFNYPNVGTDRNYYEIFGFKGFEGTEKMFHALIRYQPQGAYSFYLEKGWAKNGTGFTDRDPSLNGEEWCLGSGYLITDNIKLKSQYCDIDNIRHLTFEENPNKKEWVKDWKVYAVQLALQY